MRILGTICGLAMAAVMLPQAASAQADPPVAAFVASFDASVREIHTHMGAGEGQGTARCRALMERVFDLDAMARFALGASFEKITATQRQSYRSAFEQKITIDCVRRVREYRGEQMTLLGVRAGEGGERLAATRFAVSGENGRILTWRLRAGAPPLRALDLIVDGRSLLLSARDEYAAILKSHDGDINALITFMLR